MATALVFIEIFGCFVRRVSVKDRADVAKMGEHRIVIIA